MCIPISDWFTAAHTTYYNFTAPYRAVILHIPHTCSVTLATKTKSRFCHDTNAGSGLKSRSQKCVGAVSHLNLAKPWTRNINEVLVYQPGNNFAMVKSTMAAINHYEKI